MKEKVGMVGFLETALGVPQPDICHQNQISTITMGGWSLPLSMSIFTTFPVFVQCVHIRVGGGWQVPA